MKDLASFSHVLLGLALVLLPWLIIALAASKKPSPLIKPLSFITAAIAWAVLLPSGWLYLGFYPAIKPLIKAGPRPWAHSIFMETKEHWGLLLPIIATVAAGLVYSGKAEKSRQWWRLLAALSLLIGVMGIIVTSGAS